MDSSFLRSLGIVLGATLILWMVATLLLKDIRKSAVVTSFFLILFFSYGHVVKLVPELNLSILGFDIGPDKTLLSIYGLALLLGSYITVRTRDSLHTLINFLNVVSATLVVLALANIVPYEIRAWQAERSLTNKTSLEETNQFTPEEIAEFPDIYYLVFDRYANETTLKEYYEFDNSGFLGRLKERGFYIASKSYANYPKTFLSLASSLNLKHLGYLQDELGENFSDKSPVYEMIQDYEVWRFLKDRGYKFIHFGDWWSGTKENEFADENYNYFGLTGDEFTNNLIKTTALYPVFKKMYPNITFRETARKRTFFKFKKLREMPRKEGPKFIFAHMLIPHPPYIFDQNEDVVTEDQEANRGEKENYINQLIFTNKKIEETVDQILEKSNQPPIIIIQADEGPFTPKSEGWDKLQNWKQLSLEDLRVHMRILNVYYLPEADTSILYPSITPVNTFRVIFNLYFGTDYKLLPDKSYIFQDSEHPYKFIEITDKVRFD